jgi:16S rRNA (uracil1498-N3)-methyltransferase
VTADVFYCPPAGFAGDTVVIGGDEFNHLAHVMRKQEGDGIVVVDGMGNARDAVIRSVGRREAACSAGPVSANHREPKLRVTLAAAVLKNPSRYDFLVEKATELGVDRIVPMATERTIPSHAKSDRWRKLSLAAMKQSGRAWWPPVADLSAFGDVLREFQGWEEKIVAHEEASAGTPSGDAAADRSSGDVASDRPSGGGAATLRSTRAAGRVLLLIGPEGGFTPEEIEECLRRGFSTLHLGERRLRTETAAVAALARIIC